MRDAERDAMLESLVRLQDLVVVRAELVRTPDVAYEPLPAGLARLPAAILTMLQHHTTMVIGFYLLGLPGVGPGTASVSPEQPAAALDERPMSDVARDYRSTVADLMSAVASLDLNALLAHPYPDGDEWPQASARRLLLRLIADTGEALGELNCLFDLAQGGHLVD